MTEMEWIVKGEVGVSSKTIWSVMIGIETTPGQHCGFTYNVPLDPDDFRRCHILLRLFPKWRKRLNEVAKVFPRWKPMVDNWAKMTELFEQEHPSGKAPKLYDFMQELETEGRRLEADNSTL